MNNHVLLEIGVEELPARFIDNAEEQLKVKTSEWLESLRITYGAIKTFSTPRRLAVLIENIADKQATKQEEVRGPKTQIAKDKEGNWTKAALGFSKSQGKSPEEMYTKKVKDVEYLFLEKVEEGKETESILPNLKQMIEAIHFPQTMKWGTDNFRFSRPIRWVVALYNQTIIPFEIAGVQTGNQTKGHRFLGETITITNPLSYEERLNEQYVIVDPLKRETKIVKEIKQLEQKAGFKVQVDKGLLQEVRNLIEYPTVFHGTFHEDNLKLPNDVLITSMKEHQRYFPVTSNDSQTLLPYFVSVRNGDGLKIENVVKGNEKVLRARLADAAFFFEEDKKLSIDRYMDKLKTVIFQEDIGTMYEKSQHTCQITKQLVDKLAISDSTANNTIRATEIAKFDLVTNMVNEFTELQGVMGEKYARYFGENDQVAIAIKEHYLPKQAYGTLPTTTEGKIVSVADKLDTIVSCFSANLIPTGSQDPHGLRRQAIGMIRILLENKWSIDFEEMVSIGTSIYPLTKEQQQALQAFLHNRAAYVLHEAGIEHDVIQAVLNNGLQVFSYTKEKAALLSEKRNDAHFKSTQQALVRMLNLAKHTDNRPVVEADLQTDSEKTLYNMFTQVKKELEAKQKELDAVLALQCLEQLTEPIHAFFEHNMVMADDVKLKQNRLALVGAISQIIYSFAELSLIEWNQQH